MNPVLTGLVGSNADLIAEVFRLYIHPGDVIADVTYGRGVFWRNINQGEYQVLKSDLTDGIDFRNLPYSDNSVDVLILDPPYMHGGATVKASINECYLNQNTSHASIIRLYAGGILEATRVLKPQGLLLVKTQDETESGKQRFSHVELMQLLEMFGYLLVDLFVLIQATTPAMRENYQKSARKNHSYLLVARLKGGPR